MARGLDLAIRCVCAIEGAGSSNGTGVLIGADLVLTNHHVVDSLISTQDFSSAECRFDYTDSGDGRGTVAGQTFRITQVVAFSPPSPGDLIGGGDVFLPDRLDYAIVRIEQPVGRLPCGERSIRGWITLEERPPAPQIGAPVYILQHPGGRGWPRDQQALRCSSGDLLDEVAGGARVLHDAQTLEGSSGSPCFEEDGFRFIALHNARSGDSQGGMRRAIPLERIVDHIRGICDIAHLFVGKAAPKPVVVDERKLAQLRAKAADDRKRAAFVLMDRTSEEARFLMLLNAAVKPPTGVARKPSLNVIVSRRGDAPSYFLDRLRHLSFNFPPAGKTASWLDALKKGLADPTRAVSYAAWPALGDPDERAQELEGQLYGLDPRGRHLLILQRSIDAEWSEAAEKELLGWFAGRLAEIFADNPDGAQCVVAFITADDPDGDALAARFVAMWKGAEAPPNCGFCLRLRDIACDDLIEWRDFLDNAWGKNAVFQTAIDDLFAIQTKQPLGRVARALEVSLTKYIEDSLDASKWAPETLR
ncbi:trypsin-like serine peptidase [Methylorubrum aminovorans]